MEYTLYQNVDDHRFEVKLNDQIAFVDYKLRKDVISFIHTEVPKELNGKGVGSFLARNVLEFAQKQQLEVKPYCPFIKAYIDKHPEYQPISRFHQK